MPSAVAGTGHAEVDRCFVPYMDTHILVDSRNPPNRITWCHVSGLTLIRVRDRDDVTVKIKEKAKKREREE